MKSLIQIIAQLKEYMEPEHVDLQLGNKYWLHATSAKNVDSILENGLQIGSEVSDLTSGFGAEELEGVNLYPVWPIFLFKKTSMIYIKNLFQGSVLFAVDVSDYDLVADLPTLVDVGAFFDPDRQSIYWAGNESLGYNIDLLKNVRVENEISIADLLTPGSPEALAAIETTGTAAVLHNIPPDRISLIG